MSCRGFFSSFFHAAPVEVGDEGGGDGAAFLEVAVFDAERSRMVEDAFVFKGREAAVEFGDFAQVAHGCVLVHDTDVNGISEGLPKPVEEAHTFLAVAGQHEVAHEDAARHAAGFIEDRRARDRSHTANGGARRLEVVGGGAVAARRFFVHVFEVGQEDVDEPREALDGFAAFVGGGVVDDGDQ